MEEIGLVTFTPAPNHNESQQMHNVRILHVFHRHDDVIKWKHFPRPCVGNSPVTGEFRSQRPVTRSFDVFFDLGLNKPLS